MKKLKKKSKVNKASSNIDSARQILSQREPHHSAYGGMVPSKVKNLLTSLSKFLFLLFLFFLPTQFGKHFFPSFSYLNGVRVDYLSPTLYLTDIIVFFLFIFNFKSVVNFFKNKTVLISLGLLLVNAILAKNQPVAFYRLIKIVEFLIVFSLGQQLFKIVKEKTLLIILLLNGSFQLILTILQLVFRHSIQGVFYFFGERLFSLSTPGIAKATVKGIEFLRPYGTFSHPNSMAGFFLLLYFFILTNKKFNKYLVLRYSVAFILSCLIFLSFSKVAIITYLLLNIIYFYSSLIIKPIKTICKPCIISKALILSVISFIFLQVTTDVLTIEKRIELVKNSLNILLNNLLFGVGIGNYLIAQAKFSSKYLLFFNQPVHNIFLLFLSEAGLIISAIFLLQCFKTLKSTKIRRKHAFIILTVIITGLFDHYWLTLEQNLLLLALIYGSVSRSFLISKLRLKREVKYS